MVTGTVTSALFVLIICGCFYSTTAVRQIDVKELKCEYNEETTTNVTCQAKEHEGKKRILDLSCTLKRDIQDIVVNLRAFGVQDGKVVPLLNVTEDFCKFMDSKASAFYTDIVLKVIRETTNINHPCPYNGYVYVDNVNPDTSLIPDSVPNGEYIVELHMYEFKPENNLGMIRIDVVLSD